MKNLHFVQSVENLQGGGLGQAALGMHHAMQPLGGSTLITTCGANQIEQHDRCIQCKRTGPDSLYFSSELTKVARENVHDADWVHGHGFYVGTNAVIGGQAIKQGKALCYHPHGFFDPWILNRSRWKKRLVSILFENRNFRHVKLWRALTRKEVGQIRALGFSQPIEILPNGIRMEEIDQPTTSEDDAAFSKRLRPKRALFLGRIHPKKGLDILIPVWGQIAKQFPDWELAIVGPDEGGYLATVEEMIRQSGAADQIQVFGSVRGSRKVAAFRSSNLFVLSSYSEGFPVAIVEAAAHRLPCVITTECNFPELAEANGGWESLPTRESFSESLRAALSCDDMELRQRGEMGRHLVEQKYTWPNIAQSMHDACVALL
jgi:glycosyltransferase involved in cell wall biosynthesis